MNSEEMSAYRAFIRNVDRLLEKFGYSTQDFTSYPYETYFEDGLEAWQVLEIIGRSEGLD